VARGAADWLSDARERVHAALSLELAGMPANALDDLDRAKTCLAAAERKLREQIERRSEPGVSEGRAG
jgi:hypothetical protein